MTDTTVPENATPSAPAEQSVEATPSARVKRLLPGRVVELPLVQRALTLVDDGEERLRSRVTSLEAEAKAALSKRKKAAEVELDAVLDRVGLMRKARHLEELRAKKRARKGHARGKASA